MVVILREVVLCTPRKLCRFSGRISCFYTFCPVMSLVLFLCTHVILDVVLPSSQWNDLESTLSKTETHIDTYGHN